MKTFVMTPIVAAFLLVANGCVSIHDPNVHVQRPSDFDHYQRNILDKCKPHVLPHRMIHATMSAASTILQGNGGPVVNQVQFDEIWNQITPEIQSGGSAGDTLKPVINWEAQSTYFLPIWFANTCEKVKPLGMESDCYQISLYIYQYVEGTNCGPRSNVPVLIYIHPKTPFQIVPARVDSPERPSATPGP
jgi:hypothetical protein